MTHASGGRGPVLRTGRWAPAALLVPLAVAACGQAPAASSSPTPTTSAVAVALEGEDADAYARWQAAGIDDYRFAVTAQCFCVDQDPLVVTVRDGEVVSVTPASAEYWREAAVPVPDLFVMIADARDQYATVDVVYDAALGYPKRIAEDRIANAVDDEVTFVVTDFQPLPG